jgi:hypothetical protein
MTGDHNKFIDLKKGKSGSVAFENESFVKILGKGVMSLESENVKETNVCNPSFILEWIMKICDE